MHAVVVRAVAVAVAVDGAVDGVLRRVGVGWVDLGALDAREEPLFPFYVS